MKKKTLALLPTLLLTATVIPFAAITVEANASEKTDELIAPQTYEEYLPLTAPTDVAVSENYTAIADGNLIYIYDRQEGEYRKYTHTHSLSSSNTQNHINELHFSDDGVLYFTDHAPIDNLFALDVETFTPTQLDIACSTFVLNGETIYFAGPTGALFHAPLDDCNAYVEMRLTPKNPVLAFWDDELYFTSTDDIQQHLYKIAPHTENATFTRVADFSEALTYMCVANDVLTCTTSGGKFHTYTLPVPSEETSHTEQGAFSALTVYGDYCYVIERNVIRQYSFQTQSFASFEIGANSSAQNRLNGAKALTLIKDKLLIADNGNARISVYDRASATFQTPIETTRQALFLAADETSVLAADTAGITLYSLAAETYGMETCTFDSFTGNVIGVANVYGTYYIATDTAQNYALTMDGEWKLSQPVQMHLSNPKSLTADVYGNLYVLTSSNIYKYAESDFVNPSVEGQKLNVDLPHGVQSIAVDYNGTVYALASDAIYRGDGTAFSFDEPLVYYEDESATPAIHSFAIGVEENETYLLCEGNYLIKSSALNLPTVKTIKVNGADEKIFENASAEFTVVQTSENALLVEFDLQTLGGAEHFPYVGLERGGSQKTALKIGETDKYYLLAEYDQSANAYRTYLALISSCTPLDADDYRTEYSVEEQKTGYITSAITLYKFPYLTELLKSGELERGATVTVLGEIEKLDHAYYHVSYQTENGEMKTGYIPQAFVTDFSGLPPKSETIEAGETESDLDSVWRLAYLLLGFAAICILTDYLLLKKKKGGDDYE